MGLLDYIKLYSEEIVFASSLTLDYLTGVIPIITLGLYFTLKVSSHDNPYKKTNKIESEIFEEPYKNLEFETSRLKKLLN